MDVLFTSATPALLWSMYTKTDKTQDTDHQAKVEASACLLFLSLFIMIQIMIDPAVSGVNGGDIPAFIVQSLCLPKKLSAAHFRIIHILPLSFPVIYFLALLLIPSRMSSVSDVRTRGRSIRYCRLQYPMSLPLLLEPDSFRSLIWLSHLCLSVCELICDIFPCHAPAPP